MGNVAQLEGGAGLAVMAHPTRWALLGELAVGDQRVRELTAALGEPQNLVSYHLGVLRAAELVRTRRSAADGRELYYRANLERCGQLLVDCGAALHPGLRLQVRPTASLRGRASGRVLYLCTANSSRSQIAEALTDQLSGGAVQAYSAGSNPTHIHPNTLAIMRRYGLDVAGRHPKHFDQFASQPFDYVVTLCDRVREVCPELPGPARHLHWSIANPAEAGDTDEESYPAFEATAAELSVRIPLLLELLASSTT